MKIFSLYPTLFILLVAVFISSCKLKIEEPEFRRICNFDVKQLGLLQNTISFDVVFYNPNSFDVTVKEAASDIYLDSIYIGKFAQPAAIEVGKNAEFTLPLSGIVNLSTVLKLNFKDLVNKEVLIRANGSAKVGKAGIFITRPITYQGRHRLDMNL